MLNELLRGVAPYLASAPVILTIVALLILWTVWSAFYLYRATAKVQISFKTAMKSLGTDDNPVNFVGRYETVSAELARDPILGQQWRRFRQGLIIPIALGRPIVATIEPQRAFGLSALLRKAGADPRYHAALPGLLVGAGLLVTFLGLAAALSAAGEVVAEGVDQAHRNAALRDLLGAASVKFITSLFGLALSILYALFRKSRLKHTEQAIAHFFAVVQDRMPLRTPVALLAESNALLEKQYADIQRIGTDFFVNLGSTLEREFGAGLEQHLGPLAAAIDRLSSGLSSQNEDALQVMLRQFLVKLEGAVGDSMRGTAATIEALGQRLDGLQLGLDAAAQRMGRAAEEMASGLGRGTQAALGGITEQMAGLVRTMREAAEEATRNNRTAGDDMTRRMADTAASLTEAVAAFQRQMEDNAAQGVSRLAAPIEALVQQLRDMAEGQRQAGTEATVELAATISRTAAALEATATRVSEVLGGGAADASNRLVAATEAMRDELRDLMTRMADIFVVSGSVIKDGAIESGNVLRGAAAGLGDDVAAIGGMLREAGEAAGAALRDGGHGAGVDLTQAATTLVQGSEGLNGRLAGLGDAAAGLATQAAALDRALTAATAPLGASAADMRIAAEAARDALVPWRDTTDALSRAVDGLLGTTSAMETMLRGSTDLSEQLGRAADRFSGLDEGLARILRALQDGVGAYQLRIEEFVRKVDAGMAKSLAGLNALVATLLETAEELTDAKQAGRPATRPAQTRMRAGE